MNKPPKTILVVDDELSLVKALEEVLHSEGFKVLAARDGEEGFKMIRKHHPDLVLLDILMPLLDGLGMLEKLRACKETYCKDVAIIILTNLTSDDFSRRAKELGCTDYVVKSDTELSSVVSLVHSKLKNI